MHEHNGHRYDVVVVTNPPRPRTVEAELWYYPRDVAPKEHRGKYFARVPAPTEHEARAQVEAEFRAWVDAGSPARERS